MQLSFSRSNGIYTVILMGFGWDMMWQWRLKKKSYGLSQPTPPLVGQGRIGGNDESKEKGKVLDLYTSQVPNVMVLDKEN
jgi:hypothetical protein